MYDHAKYMDQAMKYMKKHEINPIRTFVPAFFQFPMFMSMFIGLRGMADLPVERYLFLIVGFGGRIQSSGELFRSFNLHPRLSPPGLSLYCMCNRTRMLASSARHFGPRCIYIELGCSLRSILRSSLPVL